jgi:hypothetical protein
LKASSEAWSRELREGKEKIQRKNHDVSRNQGQGELKD